MSKCAFSCLILLVVLGSIAGSVQAQSTLYVDDSAIGYNNGANWCDAFWKLQDALVAAAASSGVVTEIRVAAGTYTPDQGAGQVPGDRTETFQLLDGVALIGGYAGCAEPDHDARDIRAYETVLSGDLDGNDAEIDHYVTWGDFPTRVDNSFHVVTASGTDATAVLDGFTITAGLADDESEPGVGNGRGGGMYNVGGSPTLIDCTFSFNYAAVWAAGGGLYNSQGNPTLTRCTFYRNGVFYQGAGIYNDRGGPKLFDCMFLENGAWSGAGYAGGIYTFDGSPELTNCLFVGNIAGETAGGMEIYDGTAVLDNCLFVGNYSGDHLCGALYVDPYGGGGSLTLTNSIVWENRPEGICGDPTVRYSNVQGGWAGVGNIDANPLFVDSGEWDDRGTPEDGWDDIWYRGVGDYRLQSGSPCIDAGDNTAVPSDILDFDNDANTTEPVPFDLGGDPRFADDPAIADTGNGTAPIVEMGPYEFQSISSDPLIGDRVWMDLDDDGIQDEGEPGVASALVALYDGEGVLLDFTFTDLNGYYIFTSVAWRNHYALRFFPSPGYYLTDSDQGVDDEKDSDADPPSGFTPVFELYSLDDDTRWDAGLITLLPCLPPDESIYLYSMTLDTNEHPVLHFMDPNQPGEVTGYNVYREANPSLPKAQWPQLASNVVDMDEATSNKQWVDTSGQEPPSPGTVWYYQVTAYNGPSCDAEGPFGWPTERNCGNGLDDDLDTLTDCDDPDCTIACDPLPLELGDTWRYFKGTQEPTPYHASIAEWAQPDFNDSSWSLGASGFGYGTDCASLHDSVLDDMQNNYVSLYARIPFHVENPANVTGLTLTMDYDDGWVAYLNGVEVARSPGMGGAPGQPPTFDQTTATGDHECSGSPGAANPPEEFDLGGSIGLLVSGTNVLALQGHNRALVSSDFSLIPTLSSVTSGR